MRSAILTAGRALTLAALLTGSVGALAPAAVAVAQHEEEAHGEGGGEHAEAEHGEHAAPGVNWFTWEAGLPPPMLASLLNFGIWLGLIVFLGRKPIASFLANRRRGIEDGLGEARRLEEAAQKKYDEYSERIENLDNEVEKLRADFKRAGLEERDRIVAEASARAEKMHAEATFLVEQQLKTLRQELTREAIEAAIAAAEKILRERSTAADQQRLADEYLSRLRSSVEKGGLRARGKAVS